MLFAIGAGPQVVAVSSFDDYPPEVLKLPRVGALLDPDLERILSLRPDLVIVYESQVDLRRQLERASIPMFVYKHAALADITTTIRQLGARVGRDEGATAAIAPDRREARGHPNEGRRPAQADDLAGLWPRRARAARHLRQRRLRLPPRHADGSRRRQRLRRRASSSRCRRHPSSSCRAGRRRHPRAAIRRPPGRAQRKEIAVWQALSSVPAVRSGRIAIITDPRTVVPGPRVAEGTELIARTLHPEAFLK